MEIGLSKAIFTFVNAFFISLFFVVPFFVQKREHSPDEGYAGAPETPKWRNFILVTGLVSAVITLIIALVIEVDIISFRDA